MDSSEVFIFGLCSGLFLALILFLVIWVLQRQVARRAVRQVFGQLFPDQDPAVGRGAVPLDDEEARGG
jgi:hypothetical protein